LPIAGDWTGPSSPLMVAKDLVAASANVPALNQADLQPIIHEAIARWASAGLDAATLAKLAQVQVAIGDLPGSYLGMAEGNQIHIDTNAAGHGWFVDPTLALDEEFALSPSNRQLRAIDPRAVDRIDLLTVVEHELGHVAGLGDLNALADNLMSSVLGVGVRWNP
jgi:large repetitive protein